VQHPLQPFSASSFRKDRLDRRLFSYSAAAFEGARAERDAAATTPPFIAGPLSDGGADLSTLELDELERFLTHPSRWFCQRRLGLFLGLEADLLDEREPLEVSGLERWTLGDRLLSELVAGGTPERGLAMLRASGWLPPGALGRAVFDDVCPPARRIADRVRRLTAGARLEPIPVDLDVGGVRVRGLLRDVWPCGQVSWRFSQLGRRHELALWLRHLVLQTVAPRRVARDTVLLGQPRSGNGGIEARFRPVDDAGAELGRLVAIHRQATERPLPLFPDASRAFVHRLRQGRRRGDAEAERHALEEASKVFDREPEDVYVRKLFGDRYRPDQDFDFRTIAEEVWSALLEHREPSE
jgi:exodeoxyribonuclease V gamma subunit